MYRYIGAVRAHSMYALSSIYSRARADGRLPRCTHPRRPQRLRAICTGSVCVAAHGQLRSGLDVHAYVHEILVEALVVHLPVFHGGKLEELLELLVCARLAHVGERGAE